MYVYLLMVNLPSSIWFSHYLWLCVGEFTRSHYAATMHPTSFEKPPKSQMLTWNCIHASTHCWTVDGGETPRLPHCVHNTRGSMSHITTNASTARQLDDPICNGRLYLNCRPYAHKPLRLAAHAQHKVEVVHHLVACDPIELLHRNGSMAHTPEEVLACAQQGSGDPHIL